MPLFFWIKRFATIFVAGFAILFAVGLLKGRPVSQVVVESLIWSAIAAALFIATRLYHLSKGRRCELCQDSPLDASDADNAKTK